MNWKKTALPENLALTKRHVAANLYLGGTLSELVCQCLAARNSCFGAGDDALLPPNKCRELRENVDDWCIGCSEIIASRTISWEQKNDLSQGEFCDSAAGLVGLIAEVQDFLSRGSSNVVLFENSCARRGDPVNTLESTFGYLGDNIIHVLTPESRTFQEIEKCINEAQSGSWFVGVFIHGSEAKNIVNKMRRATHVELSLEEVRAAMKHIDRIVVSAMDFESYLIAQLEKKGTQLNS